MAMDWRATGNPLSHPGTPRKEYPRRLRDLLGTLAEAVVVGQPVIGLSPNGNVLVPGQRSVAVSSVPAPTVSTGGDGAGLHFRRLRRSGGGAKERWYHDWGPVPFHHILDPTGAKAGVSIVVSDLLVPTFDSGNAWVFFGLGHFNTATDETSLAGAWWHTNNTDLYWTSGLYDGTGSPSTTVHETAHASVSFNATGVGDAHHLAIVLDADTKTVEWYADGVLVDSYTPSAALGQMTNCPHYMYYGITESGADASIYCMGGGNPRALTLVPVD